MSSESRGKKPVHGPEALALPHDSNRARIRSALAPLHGEARVSAPQVSQLLAGHVVHILEHAEDWMRVRCRDGYEGWVHVGYLQGSSGSEDTWRISINARVREADGRVRQLPLGARIAPGADILEGEVVAADACADRFPMSPSSVAESAATFFRGASYLWGGITPWGCDCSGMVQTVFALHRTQLPRDAWQQAQAGTALPVTSFPTSDDTSVRVGDLLFFSDRTDRRITHVGIVADGYRMVHSSLRRGGVACENLDGTDPYVTRLRGMFVCARRVLG